MPLTLNEEAQPEGGAVSAVACARRLQALQRARSVAFGAGLFADPAWDILLDLFISHHDQRRLSVSAVGFGISGSPATAIRYLAILQAEGLIARVPDPTDGRRSYVELTPLGCDKLSALLDRHARSAA